MIPVICWNSFQSKNQDHIDKINDMGFKGIRIFVNIQDIPQNPAITETSAISEWQSYINHCFYTMPRGYWCWDNFTKNWWAGPEINGHDSEMMKDIFVACKDNDWIPIVCIGASEEDVPGHWLPRILPEDKWSWLGKFCKEFARYLKLSLGFNRADMEVWNEPNELQGLGFGVDKYAKLATIMCKNWKSISPNYKTHIFSCNIKEQEFLDYLLGNTLGTQDPGYPEYAVMIKALLAVTDFISTHILTDEEWTGYIDAVNYKLTNYPIVKKYPNIKQSLLEMSPISHKNFEWFAGRFNCLKGKVAFVGPVFVFKNEIVHTGDLDEVITYDLITGFILGIAGEKYDFIKLYNKEVYSMYEDEKNYNIPVSVEAFGQALGLPEKANYSPYLPVLTAFFFGNTNHYHKPEQLLSKKDFDPWLEVMLNLLAKIAGKSERVNIWYDANGNYRSEAQRAAITKSNPK